MLSRAFEKFPQTSLGLLSVQADLWFQPSSRNGLALDEWEG
jgi:hypothetical protein